MFKRLAADEDGGDSEGCGGGEGGGEGDGLVFFVAEAVYAGLCLSWESGVVPGANRPWACKLAASRGERRGGLLEEGIIWGWILIIIIKRTGRIGGNEGIGMNLRVYNKLRLILLAAV